MLARLIRFEVLDGGLLSLLDKDRNLIRIDRERFEYLPRIVQDQLVFTEFERTRLNASMDRFLPVVT